MKLGNIGTKRAVNAGELDTNFLFQQTEPVCGSGNLLVGTRKGWVCVWYDLLVLLPRSKEQRRLGFEHISILGILYELFYWSAFLTGIVHVDSVLPD